MCERLVCTVQELFAVYPEHGTARIYACGALMLGSAAPLGVEAGRILFERTSGYRNKSGQVWGVPV